ncbi:transcription termination/antitermination protein NusG [Rhizobium metallidurans]|uniref:Transcriptional antiterminator NusG n=1 Tax=Rhizobium metallidurans TaxID=1265931 RepID=A0A7W6CTJ3_9HYPH|nr:transcription termination/antitermination NusG family protein [Rhizobium metallidurans]MBB3965939.1 transcriptional antiterminator NusG [Rhizobium metallidurans]
MTMQGKMTGKKIRYRPMTEAELSAEERERIHWRCTRTDRIARIAAEKLRAASKEKIKKEPKMAKWYCLRVESGREFAVEKSLADANVEVFMPTEKMVFVRKGRRLETVKPFLRCYILVRCVGTAEAFHALSSVKDVLDIVGGASGYHVVADADVERFKALTTKSEIPYVKTDKSMKDGDTAEITDGPFAGFSCLVVAVKWCRQAKAKVVIDVAGKAFEIESMPLAFLKKS